MLKPYDNQLRIPSDYLEEMYQNNEHDYTPLKMLIGNCNVQKEHWIDRNRKDADVVIVFDVPSDSSWYAKWRIKRSLLKRVESARKKNCRIIWSVNSLTKKQRSYILKALPRYRKCAVVWETNMEEMLARGYERPCLDEGFDDFTYVIT